MARPFELSGKTALVTGGAKRIGRELALALADEGANVIIHYNTAAAEAGAVCAEIEGRGVRSWDLQADLSAPDGGDGLARACIDAAGSVQIVINNASCFSRSCLAELTSQQLAEALNLHALSALVITRVLMGTLTEDEAGRVVNLTDAHVRSYMRSHVAYNLGKRALASLTEMMALEFAPNVTVNAIAPGVFLPTPGEPAEVAEALAAKAPLGRGGDMHEIVDAMLYLLGADFVTGQTIYVDGGARLILGALG